MTPIAAIKKYFEADDGRKISMDEMKNLSSEKRHELGKLACEAMNETFEPASK